MEEEEQNMPAKKKDETPEETLEGNQETPGTETTPLPQEPTQEAPAPASEPAAPPAPEPAPVVDTPASEFTPVPAEEAEPDIPKHVALMPPTLLFPPGRMALVEKNANLQYLGAIMANGSRFHRHPHINFNVHQGLMIQMRNAFEARTEDAEKAAEDFFTTLETYLTQAYGHIPGAIAAVHVPQRVQQARDLVQQINAQGRTDGFEQVALYLLRLANAPLAHF